MKNKALKFIIYLIGYCIYPFSFLVPRSKKKWAFGSFRNGFNDNAKYLFIYLAAHRPAGIEVAWLSASRKTVRQIRHLGLTAHFINSPRGLWFALRAKYWFFNAYSSDILFFASGGATLINLWHGVGLKKIEFGTTSATSGPMFDRYVKKTLKQRFYHPECYRKPDFLLSSTDFQSVKFAEAFRINQTQCLNIGYPRNTILTASEKVRQQFIKQYEPPETTELINVIKQYRKTFVYMPTWRDSQLNVFTDNMDLSILNALMKEKNSLLLLKPHVNTRVNGKMFSQLENIHFVDGKVDIYAVLPYTDVLITDYSSILYDYILMENKDTILYLYDMDEYVKDREFNYPFLENVVGKAVYTFEELFNCVQNNDYKIDETKRVAIIEKFWDKMWNKSIDVISEEIVSKTVK